jgi:protoporphyrinogen oxidase
LKRYDIIIAGGGLSGLSLAHLCARDGLGTLVIEKNENVGGCINSRRFDSGFWLELGAHTCYNSYRNFLGIIEDCGLLGKLQSREKVPFKLLVDGQIKSFPSQLGFLELLFSVPRIFTMKKQGQSVKSYYSKIVGSRNYERVLGPALNAVPSQSADNFPADMLFKKRERRKDVIKKYTLPGGLQTVMDAITSEPGIEVIKGSAVQSVRFENDTYSITTDRETFESSALALAAPPSAAVEILKDSFPELSSLLSQINMVAVDSVGVVVKKDATSVEPVAGIISSGDIFYSAVSRDMVRDDNYRGFTFHFKPGVKEDDKFARIREVLGVQGFDNVAQSSVVLPSPVLGHDELMAGVDRLLEGKRLLLTGNYFSGLAIEDCVNRSIDEFGRLKRLLGT